MFIEYLELIQPDKFSVTQMLEPFHNTIISNKIWFYLNYNLTSIFNYTI